VNDLFWRNEITLSSSYGGSPADYAAALELIQAGKMRVREMITHRLGLAETGHFCLSLRGALGDVAISLARFQMPKSHLQANPSKRKNKSAK